jgi:formylmethanofuran dehydrogenase subunit E
LTSTLSDLLKQSAARHSHLCPRQVLGVRMGQAGLAVLGLDSPITKPTGLVIIESDGCFADGIEVATGATIGHRTLRVNDFGKVAATFVDVKTGQAIRLFPALDVREHSIAYAPDKKRSYFAQLHGYQVMPTHEMFRFQEVNLTPSLAVLLSKPGVRVNCDQCGEEIINERQVVIAGATLCQTCAGAGYYINQQHLQLNSAGFLERANLS